MSAPAERKGALSWVFDAVVAVSGLVLGMLAILDSELSNLGDRSVLALVLGVPVIVLMARFPLVLPRAAGGIEVGFDSAVLVFLACFAGPGTAL
ncbi:MAG: hypothetical protein QOF20_1574, partial [Acidimicrobiaceae bacterium]|nr:hypothetical protein [Acidimicrobiaceae bacterium]